MLINYLKYLKIGTHIINKKHKINTKHVKNKTPHIIFNNGNE